MRTLSKAQLFKNCLKYGTIVSTEMDPCASSPCLFGTCSKVTPTAYICACLTEYSGKNCETGNVL